MKNFIIHDLEGKILRTGSCPDNMMEIQAGKNEFVMEGIADDVKHEVKNGKIAEHIKTIEEIEQENLQKSWREEELKIQAKMNEILKRMAIEELEKEGKL